MSNGPYLKDDVNLVDVHRRITRALALHILKGKVILYRQDPIVKTIIDFIAEIVMAEIRGIDTTDYRNEETVHRLVMQVSGSELIPIERLREMLNLNELLHGEQDDR